MFIAQANIIYRAVKYRRGDQLAPSFGARADVDALIAAGVITETGIRAAAIAADFEGIIYEMIFYFGEKQTAAMAGAFTGIFVRGVPRIFASNHPFVEEVRAGAHEGFCLFNQEQGYIGAQANVESFTNFIKGISREARILIIRDQGLGDVIMSLPTIKAIKNVLPDAHITYATLPSNFEIVQWHDFIDVICDITQLANRLEKPIYELVINFNRCLEDYALERNRGPRVESFAKMIGIVNDVESIQPVTPVITNYIGDKAADILKNIQGPFIGYVFKAASWNRTYPIKQATKLIGELKKQFPNHIILIIDDQPSFGLFDDIPGVIDLSGKTKSVMMAGAVMEQCDFIITPDTGMAHLAASLNVPTLVLLSSQPFEWRYAHYGAHVRGILNTEAAACVPCCDWQRERVRIKFCNQTHDNQCLSTLKPEKIVREADSLFNTILSFHPKEYSVIVPFHAPTKSFCKENTGFLERIIAGNIAGEIIIVDNGSCAEWRTILEDFKKKNNLKVISFADGISYSHACNAGAAAATTDTLCFLNSDVIIKSPDWYVSFADKLKIPDVGIVGAAGRRLGSNWYGAAIVFNNDVDYVEGWCVWLTRATFEKLQGWDERFQSFYCEDADLSLRTKYVLGKNLEILSKEESQITHIGGRTIRAKNNGHIEKLEQNTIRLYEKWGHLFQPGMGFKNTGAVAVLIPAHVRESYLIECLDSVKDIADKGVTVYVGLDRMPFAKRTDYKNMEFVDLDFGNVNQTRNYLIANSLEPFIYFLDADNYVKPGAIEWLRRSMIDTGADVVYCQAEILDQSNPKWFNNQTNGLLNTYPFDASLLRERNYIDMGSMIRRSALPPGNVFDMTLPALEDWDLWLRMCAVGAQFHYVEEPLFVYRIHNENVSRNQDKWVDSITKLRKKHGADIGCKRVAPRVGLVVIAKTKQEIDKKVAEFRTQKTKPDEIFWSTHVDLQTAWVEATNKARKSSCDFIIITETDTRMVTDDFIGELIVGLDKNGKEIRKGIESNNQWENFANVAMPRRVLVENPVTTEYGIAGDTEWYVRCKRNGVAVHQVDGGHVMHGRGGIATPKMRVRAYEYGRVTARLIKDTGFYPLADYTRRQELLKEIGEETLRGINDELAAARAPSVKVKV